MGVSPSELAQLYPRLYHMAERDSWVGIQHHGLLSTEALLDLFEVPPEERLPILNQQRTESINITHAKHGKATIRDQKPLNRSKLEKCLIDCTFQAIARHVKFASLFWLTLDRLQTLMCAHQYCKKTHTVLILDTLRLATDFNQSITLAPMNTGNTRPFAHPRGLATFSPMKDYPFQSQLEARTVLHGSGTRREARCN